MRSASWTAVLLLAAACSHSEATLVDPSDRPPLGDGSWPRVLTTNVYDDRHPSWLPDGSGILYSTERADEKMHDRCIALLPAEGGSQRWRKCQTDGRYVDTTDVWEWPSMAPDGRILFMKTTGSKVMLKLGFARLSLAQSLDFSGARKVRSLPFFSTSGRQQLSTWTPRWLTPTKIAYLGVLEFWEGESFAPDTFFTGNEVMTLDLFPDTAIFTVVPGTDLASSVNIDGDPDLIYYTISGDSIVYSRRLSSGVVTPIWNFGAGRIVRDVAIRGNTLVGIVDHAVFQQDSAHGWHQRDEGGDIAVVDLATGDSLTYSRVPNWLFRHPEISPDGTRLVVEVQPYALPVLGPSKGYDAINHRADLWLFSLEEGPLAP